MRMAEAMRRKDRYVKFKDTTCDKMAHTKTNSQNNKKTPRTPRRNRLLEKTPYFCVFQISKTKVCTWPALSPG